MIISYKFPDKYSTDGADTVFDEMVEKIAAILEDMMPEGLYINIEFKEKESNE